MFAGSGTPLTVEAFNLASRVFLERPVGLLNPEVILGVGQSVVFEIRGRIDGALVEVVVCVG